MTAASATNKTPRSKPGERLYRVGRAKTGLGLYAVAPIPQRKLVIEYSGERIPTKRAQEIDRQRANLARYVNHSCDPNTEAESNRGRLMFRAIRDIAAGEEITLDYGEEHMELYFGKAGCLCPSCIEEKKQIRAKARAKKKSVTKAARRRG
jgi:SET domain-containing protein